MASESKRTVLVAFAANLAIAVAKPTLTTIRPDKAQIAHLAVQLLGDRLDDEAGTRAREPRELEARFDLVVRESTGG